MKTHSSLRQWLIIGGIAALTGAACFVAFQQATHLTVSPAAAQTTKGIDAASAKPPSSTISSQPTQQGAASVSSSSASSPLPDRPSSRKEMAVADQKPAGSPSPANASANVPRSAASFTDTGNRTRTVAPRPIKPDELERFQPVVFPGGKPHYEGQPVAAFVRVASTGKDVKLSPNQMGEYPRVYLQPGETSRVMLDFPKTAPNTPVAVTAQDGGAIMDGKPSAAPVIDAAGHLGFDFTASENPGIHRVSFATPEGETLFLDFWVGPELTLRKL